MDVWGCAVGSVACADQIFLYKNKQKTPPTYHVEKSMTAMYIGVPGT